MWVKIEHLLPWGPAMRARRPPWNRSGGSAAVWALAAIVWTVFQIKTSQRKVHHSVPLGPPNPHFKFGIDGLISPAPTDAWFLPGFLPPTSQGWEGFSQGPDVLGTSQSPYWDVVDWSVALLVDCC